MLFPRVRQMNLHGKGDIFRRLALPRQAARRICAQQQLNLSPPIPLHSSLDRRYSPSLFPQLVCFKVQSTIIMRFPTPVLCNMNPIPVMILLLLIMRWPKQNWKVMLYLLSEDRPHPANSRSVLQHRPLFLPICVLVLVLHLLSHHHGPCRPFR